MYEYIWIKGMLYYLSSLKIFKGKCSNLSEKRFQWFFTISFYLFNLWKYPVHNLPNRDSPRLWSWVSGNFQSFFAQKVENVIDKSVRLSLYWIFRLLDFDEPLFRSRDRGEPFTLLSGLETRIRFSENLKNSSESYWRILYIFLGCKRIIEWIVLIDALNNTNISKHHDF